MFFFMLAQARHVLCSEHWPCQQYSLLPQMKSSPLLKQIIPAEFTRKPFAKPYLWMSNFMHSTQFSPLVGPQCPLQQEHFVYNFPPQQNLPDVPRCGRLSIFSKQSLCLVRSVLQSWWGALLYESSMIYSIRSGCCSLVWAITLSLDSFCSQYRHWMRWKKVQLYLKCFSSLSSTYFSLHNWHTSYIWLICLAQGLACTQKGARRQKGHLLYTLLLVLATQEPQKSFLHFQLRQLEGCRAYLQQI